MQKYARRLFVLLGLVFAMLTLLWQVGTAMERVQTVSPSSVTISGPVNGRAQNWITFTAAVSPSTATQPITYTWQTSLVRTDGLTNTYSANWLIPGTYTITVTADNGGPSVQDTLVVTIGPMFDEPAAIFTSRTALNGLVNTSNQAIFGPDSCIAYGDPFSPSTSPWQPGLHTYRYRIDIPASYPNNIVRVELLDPDSINQVGNTAVVTHTQTAVSNSYPITSSLTCSLTNQKNSCSIQTGEVALLGSNLTLDEINLYWFMRIDQNRGTGIPGVCGNPTTYEPAFNTTTVYELYYQSQNPDNSVSRMDIASYTGQTGDGVRDNGNHLTDLHWVSPGGAASFDQPATVPVDAGSIGTFVIDLTQDVPGIETDPDTGERYLYLDVTAVSGGSENGFEIWAGPPSFVNSVPSDVNGRNLYVLDNPGVFDSGGVTIHALDYLPLNNNYSNNQDLPLLDLGPAMAGQSVYVSLFDMDSGSRPPIIFYLDTIPPSDWSLTFGVPGQDDPDGVADGERCLPGSCNTQFVDPSYRIEIPSLLPECYTDGPALERCTPFYGGRLMAQFVGGTSDTYGWLVNSPPPPSIDTNVGCTAFPIGVSEAIRSVTPPGTGSNPFPEAVDFEYPLTPPTYTDFANHVPDIPLESAQPGYVFKVPNGAGPGSFAWLVWNTVISANANTLAESLTWPGDSTDYTPLPFGRFKGYQEPGDPTDRSLQMVDWIAASTGAINSSSVRAQINNHIDLGRTLRLPIWDVTNGQVGSNFQMLTSGFALFRIQGYTLNQSQGAWLLLEFMGWDESCGQTSPVNVALKGLEGGGRQSVDTAVLIIAFIVLGLGTVLFIQYKISRQR